MFRYNDAILVFNPHRSRNSCGGFHNGWKQRSSWLATFPIHRSRLTLRFVSGLSRKDLQKHFFNLCLNLFVGFGVICQIDALSIFRVDDNAFWGVMYFSSRPHWIHREYANNFTNCAIESWTMILKLPNCYVWESCWRWSASNKCRIQNFFHCEQA